MEIKYKSIFKKDIENLIMYENAMNFKSNSKLALLDLDKYFISINKSIKNITKEEYYNYIYNYDDSNYDSYKRYLTILKLSRYLIRFGNTNVFVEEVMFDNNSDFKPHIYTKTEIRKIFFKIDSMKFEKKNLNYEYPVLFRLLYSTGMRISEALKIKGKNVNLKNGEIDIILSKENISRKIYLSKTMIEVLKKYFNLMNFKNNDYIFSVSEASSLSVFKKVIKELNIKIQRIRLHDLRHTFSTMALEKLIKKNFEPKEALAYLEQYIGHSNERSSEYYLHMTDKMMNEVLKKSKEYDSELYSEIGADDNE